MVVQDCFNGFPKLIRKGLINNAVKPKVCTGSPKLTRVCNLQLLIYLGHLCNDQFESNLQALEESDSAFSTGRQDVLAPLSS